MYLINPKFCLNSQPKDISLDPGCRMNGLIIHKFFSGSGWNLLYMDLIYLTVGSVETCGYFSCKLYHNIYTDPGFGYLK